MDRHPVFKLARPDDLLVIDVTTEGLEPRPSATGPRGSARFELRAPEGVTGLLKLRLPPQQLLEDTAGKDGNATDAGRTIVTDPSEVVFMVTADDPPIPTSVEGILDAARRLPRFIGTEEASTVPDRPAPNPEQLGTRFDLPYVLHLRVPKRSLRLIHDREVAEHDGRVALWSSEVAIGPDDTDRKRTIKVWFDVLGKATGPPTGEAPSRAMALDDRLQVIARADVGRGSGPIAADPARNRLYIVSRGPEEAGVSMLDATTLKTLTHRVLGAGPHDVVVDSAAGLVYVSHWIGRKVIVLRADDLAPVDEIGDPSFSGPLGMAVDPATKRLYVARTNRSSEPNVEALSVIQRHATGEHTIDRTLPLGTNVRPWDVALDADAGLVYVLGLGGNAVAPQLIVLDRQSLDEQGRVVVGGAPTAVTAQPGTGIAHVAMGSGVHVVDGRRLVVVAHVPGPAATSIASGAGNRIVSGAVDGGVVRVVAPGALAATEWR